jgi:hypothetical protein
MQYEVVLESLEEFSKSGNADNATKAAALLDRFQKGCICLMLILL